MWGVRMSSSCLPPVRASLSPKRRAGWGRRRAAGPNPPGGGHGCGGRSGSAGPMAGRGRPGGVAEEPDDPGNEAEGRTRNILFPVPDLKRKVSRRRAMSFCRRPSSRCRSFGPPPAALSLRPSQLQRMALGKRLWGLQGPVVERPRRGACPRPRATGREPESAPVLVPVGPVRTGTGLSDGEVPGQCLWHVSSCNARG
jgi:hypothetical protein